MSFYDDVEVRYQLCKHKTDNPNQWDPDPNWYVAYAILALVRGAAQDGVLKNRPTNFTPSEEQK